MQRKRIRAYIIYFVILLCILSPLFIPAEVKQGIDGDVRIIKMPLGIKVAEFISRDFHYRRLAKEIVSNSKTGKERVLAIFNWVVQNINTDYPRRGNWHIVDDHILNIIIRRYGTADQIADVFTTLVSYAGYEAFWEKLRTKSFHKAYILSFVRIDEEWYIFDACNRKYFMTENDLRIPTPAGPTYKEYLKTMDKSRFKSCIRRAGKQKIYSRIVFELNNLFHKKGKDNNTQEDNFRNE